ncbi:MAG: HDIG domain-containing protein, partial [Candidatus Kapabacteria bacterium]|nr:HDIG domain-containing protein [Candidatus Kapabacteria bacterium]
DVPIVSSDLATKINALDATTRRTLHQALLADAPGLIAEAYRVGIVNNHRPPGRSPIVSIRMGASEELVAMSTITDANRLQELARNELRLSGSLLAIATEMLRSVCKPNLLYDEALTQRSRDDAAAAVPRTLDFVRQGDVVVRKTQRIDERTMERLSAYREASYARSDVSLSWIVVAGSVLHAASVLAILVIYLLFLRRRSWDRNGQLASLLSLPVLTAAMSWATVRAPGTMPLEYIIVIPALSMLISVLYEARTAFILTLVMSLTLAGVRGHDHAAGLVMLIAGMLAAYSTTNIQSRTQIFRSILFVFVGIVVAILGVDLERATPFETTLLKLMFGTANAVISPLITFGVIIAMERFFKLATDLRVDEFDTTTHPLLKQLNERAPGTYQHTMSVARLAEAAARDIGANALLTKVGALYHDIGKLEKSEYFVENQIDIGNKHDKLPPKRSAAIIRQHVQDGIELAKEYGIPERIWKFIPMHHGTVIIKHFYNRALDESLLKDAVVDEADYRYAGPIPDSRETAIVMLADAAEALSRLVDTSQREDIDAAVEQIIIDRFVDGQLDNSSLTITELSIIRESFVRNLLGTAHQRVRYQEAPRTS